ncbi:TolB family protein [Robiginitomaculum antarcticum]|uniref:TolB family protein n=1 Tax=Robiginitomaculum antarcticum TaxID=437507 RepID=UPI0003A2A855|nr:PD40 domain-containing protein [Robiginitomaculum antarcticum]
MKYLLSIPFKAVITASLISLAGAAVAQDAKPKANLPQTDIFLFDLSLDSETALFNGRNVTARQGYDNQPSFTPDSQSFLYARGDDYQTDVWEYSIETGEARRITNTESSEFSPVATADNLTISFVTDGAGAIQNVVTVTRDNPDLQTKLLPASALREPVGYYSWNVDSGDVLFWSRYGFNVTLASSTSQATHYVSGDAVPSTPYLIPGTQNFSFVHRQGNGQVWIKSVDPKTKAVRPITPIKGSNANYGWTPGGDILMIEKDRLYRWREDADGWAEIADLSEFGIKDAARLAVSPDSTKLAVVGNAIETD